MPKPKFDKSKYSKAGKEQHPVKVVSTKRPVTKPPAKDKTVLNSVRWACQELARWAGEGDMGAISQQASSGAVSTLGSQTPGSALLLRSFGPQLRQLKKNVSFYPQV